MMAITKTIGGDRVGSGQKMQAHLHNYFRSTHNLSEKFASSMASGILYPCLCKLAMRGDSFEIGINADARTIPTVGPLFGSYKMQVDIYQCPVRLYQGILHNNPQAIGLKMNQVKFPMLHIKTTTVAGDGYTNAKVSNSALLKYLGLSGLGRNGSRWATGGQIGRKILALPALSYYDIFKTYYANKQEENAYVISLNEFAEETKLIKVEYFEPNGNTNTYTGVNVVNEYNTSEMEQNTKCIVRLTYNNLNELLNNNETTDCIEFRVEDENDTTINSGTLKFKNIKEWTSTPKEPGIPIAYDAIIGTNEIVLTFNNIYNKKVTIYLTPSIAEVNFNKINKMYLRPFFLDSIDDMRYDLLSANRIGQTFTIGAGEDEENAGYPYKALYETTSAGVMHNHYPLNGLVLKTYQNDIFNNWLNADWIEGENGINELSKVAIVDGKFSMDSLSFAQKLYNMLNRVALAGNTYEDWQDVVYEEVKRRQIESPIFCGGMSQEVMFEEIVQNAPAEVNGKESQLGTLGGRGTLIRGTKKGGKIHIKCDEACFIIGIVSLTPRVYQTQGNEFYNTEILSMDDLHKPGMDGIGFQDLIGERMAAFDTALDGDTILGRSKIGKLPAWIEYMTSYDKAYGDFAEEGGKGFMILNRNYEMDETTHAIKDATTYIDPSKYNYAFAVQELEAQNFWVQINFDIKARRLMSARLIPNV